MFFLGKIYHFPSKTKTKKHALPTIWRLSVRALMSFAERVLHTLYVCGIMQQEIDAAPTYPSTSMTVNVDIWDF